MERAFLKPESILKSPPFQKYFEEKNHYKKTYI